MAKKKSSGGRRTVKVPKLALLLPTAKIGFELIAGRPGVSPGFMNTVKSDPVQALEELADGLAMEFTGYRPGFSGGAPSWDPKLPLENLAIGYVGKAAHWGAGKLGVNRTLRDLGIPLQI